MQKIAFLGTILLMCIVLSSCSTHINSNDLSHQLSTHEVRNFENWQHHLNIPLSERIEPASELLIDYLRIDNKMNGYSSSPKQPKHWRPFAKDVIAAIDEFPPKVRVLFDKYVIGISLVSGLGSSAFTDFLIEHNQHKMGVIVLDIQALDMKANDWATWKENTPFLLSDGLKPQIQIASGVENNRKAALSYVILHELGHLVGPSVQAHNHWSKKPEPANYKFSSISWKVNENIIQSKSLFPEREIIRFYADQDKKTSNHRIPSIYNSWYKTDFVSLYAAVNLYEDFAETFAMYVHVVMQGNPWKLTLINNEKIFSTFDKPILQERCKYKKEYIASIFGESQHDHISF